MTVHHFIKNLYVAATIAILSLPAAAGKDTATPERPQAPDVAIGENAPAADVTIRGSVVDADGTAVSDAEVLVYPRPPFPGEKDFEMEPIGQAVSGPDGSFQVTIGQGPFAVTARATGMLAYQGFGGRSGDRDIIEGLLVHLKPLARATGRVLDPEGQPVAGQLVRFSRSYGYSAWHATTYEKILQQARGRFSVVTDEDGRFEATSPEGLDYQVEVSSRFAPYLESRTVTDGAEILIQLEAGEVAAGRVLLPDGQPAAGARVRFHAYQYSRDARTDATGRFEIRGIRRYDRSYITVGYPDAAVFCLQPVPKDTSNLELKLEQGQIIEGRVVDAKGQGIEGARIKAVGTRVVDPLATHVGIETYTWEWANACDQTRSDEDGRFRFQKLYAGKYELTAALEELHIGAVATTARTGGGEITMELSPATTRRAAMALLVLGQASGEPVPEAKVRISPAGGGRWRDLVTDDAGRANAQGFEPGLYGVEIDHAGFALGRERLDLRLGENPVQIELSEPVDVELRIRTSDGPLNPDASISLRRANGELVSFPLGDQKAFQKLLHDGVVTLTRAPAEKVTLIVDPGEGKGLIEQPLDLRVASGTVMDVLLEPKKGPVLFIIIVVGVIVLFISGWMITKRRKP